MIIAHRFRAEQIDFADFFDSSARGALGDPFTARIDGTDTGRTGGDEGKQAGKTRQKERILARDPPTSNTMSGLKALRGEVVMTARKLEESLPEARRKEIFLALVEFQEQMSVINVAESRKLIAERFGVTEGQIKVIEREGLEAQWPPL